MSLQGLFQGVPLVSTLTGKGKEQRAVGQAGLPSSLTEALPSYQVRMPFQARIPSQVAPSWGMGAWPLYSRPNQAVVECCPCPLGA